MSKAVNAALFKAITLECKMAYKGFTIMNGLKAKRVIVEEVFGWIHIFIYLIIHRIINYFVNILPKN